ncbi:MAG: DUF4922 domain-containing protein [Prevotellaceae bacterium]|jgi:hypothetical protein|nr:DUF4922 domain-containing protein [Prevotellaceae bacterium]
MQNQIYSLINEQLLHWELARKNNFALSSGLQKKLNFGSFSVYIKHNASRVASLKANIDEKSIKERPCFLCAENRPEVQKGVEIGDFTTLLNPYPIFENHLTIARKTHSQQEILPCFTDFVRFAEILPDFAIFYNGAKCGASCPDHQHFQAAPKASFPVLSDIKFNSENLKNLHKTQKYRIFSIQNYLRNLLCIEADNAETLKKIFEQEYFRLQNGENSEPMFNILLVIEKGIYRLVIFPRKAFRPQQFFAKNEKERLLFSPGTVEMSGIFVTSDEDTFAKASKNDIIDIYSQIS